MVGYDCAKGICSAMMARKKELALLIVYGTALWMPCIIILLSYSTIWAYISSHSKYLKVRKYKKQVNLIPYPPKN